MHFYFTSYPSILKINGRITTKLDGIQRYCYLEIKENLFFEILPVNEGENTFLPVSFFLSYDFLNNPPKYVEVTNLCGGYALNFLPVTATRETVVLYQKPALANNQRILCTFFCDGDYKLSLDKNQDFYLESGMPKLNNINFTVKNIKNNEFLIFTAEAAGGAAATNGGSPAGGEGKFLAVYDTSEKIRLTLRQFCESIDTENKINIKTFFYDTLRHCAEAVFDYNGQFFVSNYKCAPTNLNYSSELLPFIFFESLLCRGEGAESLLCAELKAQINEIREFTGDFCAVIPPPHFITEKCVGIIYRQKNNYFTCKYMSAEISGGLITNIYSMN